MNNSKKLKTKKVKKDHIIEQKPITKMSKPWIIASAIVLVLLIGALLFDQLYEATLVTIDGKSYKQSDLSYHFYTVESQFDYYDQMFGGGGTYWNMTYDQETGATIRDMAKEQVVDNVVYTEILYKEAVAEGYTLTDEEKETISTNVDSLLKDQISASEKSRNDFTKASLTEELSKTTLVSRYRQDKIDSFEIDDEGIKADIKFEDYRQYDIETLFISTSTTDEDNNSVTMSEEEKAVAYDKIKSYYDSAKSTEDWSALLPEEEEEVTYSSTNFLQSGTTYSEDMEAVMMKLNNGDVSDIYEADNGYYIVRMKDNNSSESYDNAVEEAITTAENDAFNEYYEKIKKEHTYTINEKALKSLNMGNIAID